MSEERQTGERPEDQAPDDPTRYEEGAAAPPGEGSDEDHKEKVAGRGHDPSDEDAYEGGLPA